MKAGYAPLWIKYALSGRARNTMQPACEGITRLIEGLAGYSIHATGSAQLLVEALGDYRSLFSDGHAYRTAAREQMRRLAAVMPPYAPLINSMNSAFLAFARGHDLAAQSTVFLRDTWQAQAAMQEIVSRLLANRRAVFTHTFSQTLSACLVQLKKRGLCFSVALSESMPNRDGRLTRQALLAADIPCEAGLDAELLQLVKNRDIALFGCESVLPDGRVVGKVGQGIAAEACYRHGIPVYIYAGISKLLPQALSGVETLIKKEPVPGGYEDMPICLFDVTDRRFITGIITEKGILSPDVACSFTEHDLSPELLSLLGDAPAPLASITQ